MLTVMVMVMVMLMMLDDGCSREVPCETVVPRYRYCFPVLCNNHTAYPLHRYCGRRNLRNRHW